MDFNAIPTGENVPHEVASIRHRTRSLRAFGDFLTPKRPMLKIGTAARGASRLTYVIK